MSGRPGRCPYVHVASCAIIEILIHSRIFILSFLDQLNPQQREAVETTDGPVLILAGAGSGKTRVITYRIAHLIENLGVMPESILAMTFTNKAASEMAERVEKLVGGLSIAKPFLATFHSFCVRVLRRDIEALRIPSSVPGSPPIGYTKNFVIYDESDQQQLVRSVMRRLGIDDKQTTPRSVLAHIFVGEKPHARSAGGLSAIWRSEDRACGADLRRISERVGESKCFRLRRPAARNGAFAEGCARSPRIL